MNTNTENQIDYQEEFLRCRMLKKNQEYYAKKLNRSQTNISLALSGRNKTLLKRIHTHNNWLEKNYV